jgi:hypothetical protein
MHENTNLSNGYRVFITPFGTSTVNAIVNEMPWTYFVNLSSNAEVAANEFEKTNNSLPFANLLSILGVQYVIIYKGPYIIRTSRDSNFEGPAVFVPAGLPWQLTYIPLGSWQNWSIKFSQSKYFTEVVNLSSAVIYRNDQFSGLLYAYNIQSNFSLDARSHA